MLRRARGCQPREMVAVLTGNADHVTAFEELPNRATDADRFDVDPIEFHAAVANAEAAGRVFLGFAHSHPEGPSRLSDTDRRELWRDCVQVLIDPHGDLLAFRLRGPGRAAVERLAVLDEAS